MIFLPVASIDFWRLYAQVRGWLYQPAALRCCETYFNSFSWIHLVEFIYVGPDMQFCSWERSLFVPPSSGRCLNKPCVGAVWQCFLTQISVYGLSYSVAPMLQYMRRWMRDYMQCWMQECMQFWVIFIVVLGHSDVRASISFFSFATASCLPLRYCVPRSLPCLLPWVGSCDCQNCRRMSAKLIIFGSQTTWTTCTGMGIAVAVIMLSFNVWLSCCHSIDGYHAVIQ